MSLERRHRPGGYYRSIVRRERYRMAEETANEELNLFKIGEPSTAFHPKNTDNEGTVIYLADKIKERKTKRRRERESVATPQDIANRIREQNERCVGYEHLLGHPAKLPMPWLRYRVKHWEEIQRLKGNSITLSSVATDPAFAVIIKP